MKFLTTRSKTLFAALFMLAAGVFAQEKVTVSDSELSQFVQAYKEVQIINLDVQSKMMAIVQESGLELYRFNELYMEAMETGADVPDSANAEEAKQFKAIADKIEAMQPELEKQYEAVVTKQGMNADRFEEIATALQTDTELQEKLQAKMME